MKRSTRFTILIATALLFTVLMGRHAQSQGELTHEVVPAIAFVSTRHAPLANVFGAAEIYYMTADGTTLRLTDNAFGDGFPALAPGGKRIAFDSNRLRADGEPINVSDLFVMNARGDDQVHLVRGSSASWSPAGEHLAITRPRPGPGSQSGRIPARRPPIATFSR